MRRTIVYSQVFNPEIFANVLAGFFQSFYGKPPFNEDHWVCNQCSPPTDPSLGIRSESRFWIPGRCPICQSELVKFWSGDRIREYLLHIQGFPGFWMYAAFAVGGSLVGWIWGFDKNFDGDQYWYIDFIGVDPRLRRSRWESILITLALRYKIKYKLNQRGYLDFFFSVRGLPAVNFLIAAAENADRNQKSGVMCRTLIDAHTLVKHLKYMGFRRIREDPCNPRRFFFILPF